VPSATNYRPEMTSAGLRPTSPVYAIDEYQNSHEMYVADERALTIYVDSYEIVTLMTIGSQPELLALGYLKNQGLISDIKDIKSVQVDWEVGAAAITTFASRDDWLERLGPRIVTTGCGQGTMYGDIMEKLDDIHLTPKKIKQSAVYELLQNLNAHNEVYKTAGAVHGCALCEDTKVLIFIEDVGRHNAVDAIAGKMWLEGTDGNNKLFYTTGRLTSEMVIKIAYMGIPALLSRSGITQMGYNLAKDLNVMMFSRAKGKHFYIYTGAEHLVYDVELPSRVKVNH
jgi:FdhD protein